MGPYLQVSFDHIWPGAAESCFARVDPGLALEKWRALLKERGAFHGQAAATVREGICGRSRSVG